MFSKQVVDGSLEAARVAEVFARVMTPELARRLQAGMVQLPDGVVRLHVKGMTRREELRLRALLRAFRLEVVGEPPTASRPAPR